MDDIDVWRSAQHLMTLHGADAALVAADLASARLADGNMRGVLIWQRVRHAINELSRPCGGERLN